MAKQHPKILSLEAKHCRMGKISNNLEKHGEEYVTAFTIPISGVMLTKDELNEFMGDKHCHASWFETKRDVQQPMPWWGTESFGISGAYASDSLVIVVSGDRALEFEAEEPEEEGADVRPACELSRITLTPQVGGLTEMAFALSVRPDLGKTNLMLQEHQHREVKLSILEASAKERAEKQAALPLAPAEDGATVMGATADAGNNGGRPDTAH